MGAFAGAQSILSITRHFTPSIRANMITSMQEAKYCLAGRLKLQGDVLCLHATDDGKLASGGDCLLNNLELAAELI